MRSEFEPFNTSIEEEDGRRRRAVGSDQIQINYRLLPAVVPERLSLQAYLKLDYFINILTEL